jgi:hypothetical protein
MALRDQHAREHSEVQVKAFAKKSREIEASWQALPYASATPEGFSEILLGKINWSKLTLSELQQVRLTVRLTELIHYLQGPEFEEYYRLRTEGLQYRLKPSKEIQELFAKTPVAHPEDSSEEPKEMLKWLWNTCHKEGERTTVPKITAVCLDQIAVATSHTNSSWSVLEGEVRKGFTVANVAYDPGFRYLSLEKSSVENPGEPLFFHLSFFAKFNGTEYASPVYLSLRWLDQEQTWVLSGMITDTWSRVRTMF